MYCDHLFVPLLTSKITQPFPWCGGPQMNIWGSPLAKAKALSAMVPTQTSFKGFHEVISFFRGNLVLVWGIWHLHRAWGSPAVLDVLHCWTPANACSATLASCLARSSTSDTHAWTVCICACVCVSLSVFQEHNFAALALINISSCCLLQLTLGRKRELPADTDVTVRLL